MCQVPKIWRVKEKQQKNPKNKFKAPKPKVENQQHEEPSGSKKNKRKGHHGKEKVNCSYCGKGFHPEHAYMKNKLDEATSLLDKNHINLPESFWRRDQQDREPQHERGHALMESTSKSKALLIDYGALNHMWLKETPSHLWRPENPFPSTWEMTPPSFHKDKVLLILRMAIFQMFCMYCIWHQTSWVFIKWHIQ